MIFLLQVLRICLITFLTKIYKGNKFLLLRTQMILQDSLVLIFGILISALPFVTLGIFISILLEVWLPADKLLKFLPKNRYISHLIIAFLGFFMPVCECGNVPLLRKMMQKGLSLSQGLTFFLAAPLVNPITWFTTREAFNLDPNIAWIRLISGYVIAVTIGLIFSFETDPQKWLQDKFLDSMCKTTFTQTNSIKNTLTKINLSIALFVKEFWQLMRMLLLGSIIATLCQLLIPRDIVLTIGQNPVLSIIAMILLALIVSMCSSVDAFFALSWAGDFTLGSIMSFLIFGPMIDIKIFAMISSTFKVKFLTRLLILVTLFSIIVGFLVNLLYRQYYFVF
jgi:uncharacterized protein